MIDKRNTFIMIPPMENWLRHNFLTFVLVSKVKTYKVNGPFYSVGFGAGKRHTTDMLREFLIFLPAPYKVF